MPEIPQPLTQKEMAQALKTEKRDEVTRLTMVTEYLMSRMLQFKLQGLTRSKEAVHVDKKIQEHNALIHEMKTFVEYLENTYLK